MKFRFFIAMLLCCACAQVGEYTTFGVGFGGDPILDGLQKGITSAAASRLGGRCYAMCPTGSVCNRESGLCEPTPEVQGEVVIQPAKPKSP